jgi:hypothetical protein
MLHGVLANPSTILTPAQIQTFLQQHIADPGDPMFGGQTFTLTRDVDNIVGTSGDDVFNGIFGNSTNATFNAGDSIDGKGGNDTLNLIANGNTASDPVTVKDVDLINVQVAAASGATLDALLFDGVGAIHSKDSVAQLTINNLKLGTKVGLNNTGANGLTATFTGTSGTSDEVIVELNKAGTKSGTTINRATVDVSSGNTIEAVKINVLGGDNYVTINGGNVNKTLTITGDGTGVANINTTNVVTTVDASAYKGKLDLTLGGTSNVKVTGTAQDDNIRLGTTLNSADTIIGGDGNDTLYATLSATQTPTVSGVEKGVLIFTGTSGIYNASKTTGMTSVDLVMGSGVDAAISSAKAELATINIKNDASTAVTWGNVTIGYATGANANATINIGGKSDQTIGKLTVSNATTVTIQSSNKNATINGNLTLNDATELNLIAKEGKLTVGSSANITADKVETLNITADGKEVDATGGSNSYDALKTLNVTATGAKATANVIVSPSSGDVSVSEINVKGTDATSQLDVTVEASTSGSTTFSAVNFEVNGTGGTQTLKLISDSTSGFTIAALNVKAAENATAKVVIDEQVSSGGATIQGGIFEGKGNITIEGDGTNTDNIDLRNIDRSLLDANSTLKIVLNNDGDVYGTNGKDTIDVASGDVTVHFADSAASNGVDSITGYSSGDEINVKDFVSSVSHLSSGQNANSDDLDLTSNNLGYLYNVTGGTLSADKVKTSSTATSATGEVIMNDNAKAVVLVTDNSSADLTSGDTFKVYYVYDADSSVGTTNFVVELVGIVTAGGTITSSDLLDSIV